MAVLLSLRIDPEGGVTPFIDGQPLAEAVSLARLPTLAVLKADPYSQGRTLTAAPSNGSCLSWRLAASRSPVLRTATVVHRASSPRERPWALGSVHARERKFAQRG